MPIGDFQRIHYFGGQEIEVEFSEEGDDLNQAFRNFLLLNDKDRLSDSRHVFAYYKDFHHEIGGGSWLDDVMGIPKEPEEIWTSVHPKMIKVDRDRFDGAPFVVLLAECDWEDEHGLMMCWEFGKTLRKVGAYDGNFRHSRGTPTNTIYQGSLPEFTTYREQT